MNGIVFVSGEISDRRHTLTAFLNMDAGLVFDDVEYHIDGGEVNDDLLVRAEHKRRVLNLWDRLLMGSAIRAENRRTNDCFARLNAWRTADIGDRWMKLKNG